METKIVWYADEIHMGLLLRDLLKSAWAGIVVALTVCLGIVVYDHCLYQPEYTAETVLSVSIRSGNIYESMSTTWSKASETAQMYREVFCSDMMERMIRDELQNDHMFFEIRCDVTEQTNILHVYATADTPENAYRVMQALQECYAAVSDQLFGEETLNVLRYPQLPVKPSNVPDTRYRVLTGIFLSLGVVMIVGGVLSVARPTIKTIAGAKRLMGALPICVLFHEDSRAGRWHKKSWHAPLITNGDVSRRFLEAGTYLAYKLRKAMAAAGHQIMLVSGAAACEGRTTVAANLALAMAQYGKTVAIVDLDLRRPAVDRVLGNYHKLDLITCIAKGLPETWDVSRKLHVLALKTACADNDRILYDPGLKDLLEELRKRVDLVIVDSSSYTTVADTAILLDYVDCSMMVLRQDWTHPEVCRALMKTLKVSKAEYLGYVFNDYRDNKIIYSETGQYSKYRQNETEGSEK